MYNKMSMVEEELKDMIHADIIADTPEITDDELEDQVNGDYNTLVDIDFLLKQHDFIVKSIVESDVKDEYEKYYNVYINVTNSSGKTKEQLSDIYKNYHPRYYKSGNQEYFLVNHISEHSYYFIALEGKKVKRFDKWLRVMNRLQNKYRFTELPSFFGKKRAKNSKKRAKNSKKRAKNSKK